MKNSLRISKKRCPWARAEPLIIDYHDTEWGVPAHSDRKLLEMLILEGAQAGLSWVTVLRKRPEYFKAFDGFDAEKIASYSDSKIEELLANPGIIRNRLKVRSAIRNAQAFLNVRSEFGSFDSYLWQFVDYKPIQNHFQSTGDIPARSAESDAMSKDLGGRGFSFVGSTICYALMQAVGMMNDHLVSCFRWKEVGEETKRR